MMPCFDDFLPNSGWGDYFFLPFDLLLLRLIMCAGWVVFFFFFGQLYIRMGMGLGFNDFYLAFAVAGNYLAFVLSLSLGQVVQYEGRGLFPRWSGFCICWGSE